MLFFPYDFDLEEDLELPELPLLDRDLDLDRELKLPERLLDEEADFLSFLLSFFFLGDSSEFVFLLSLFPLLVLSADRECDDFGVKVFFVLSADFSFVGVVIVFDLGDGDGEEDEECLGDGDLLLEWWVEWRWWCLSSESEELDLLLERDRDTERLPSEDGDLEDE